MRGVKEVAIQNVHSELVITANMPPNTQSESAGTIKVTQDIYERNRSGQGSKNHLCNLQLKVQVVGSQR